GAHQRLDRMYRLYIKSAFPLRSRVLSSERERILSRPGDVDSQGVLSQPPLLETVPIYPTSGKNLDEAASTLPVEYGGLSGLAKKLFPADIKLYQHQYESLRRALEANNPADLVITTGTGSGKTECFLLPLLAQLAHDSLSWPAPANLTQQQR